ncbi:MULTISPECIES: DUF1361 domain-containing protein [Pseudanabaena]|uniref:DUF1361 domain-containing protein n=2 Tax=Pseudanabaena TaxID=1152 RepID=L8MTX7_9CYAN|nr:MULTISPECIES: DUF1361 domain-containing protein [Pseudanabaena]ELS30891.1 protein of unknown function DUF1361 [Pseudanabaena biceps PCC 7429]MDG3496848.1 DUF1361 domain-containing protein [Pseudanabaena catenata USMAC16]
MSEAFSQFLDNFQWMSWNLFLAIIPCLLSFILFIKRSPKRLPQNIMWWLGLTIFILFLPNAPYIITDIIHFVDDVRTPEISDNGIIFVLIPQYTIFILCGFQCYVISLMRLIQYLGWLKLIERITFMEVAMNFICAIGVYLGRVNRLNSWDVLTQPQYVIQHVFQNLENPNFFFGTILFFLVFTSLYYVFKWINLAIAFYWQNHVDRVST